MDKRKKGRHREAKTKSSKINIHISSEYHREKPGDPHIRRKRKCPATQNPQDQLRISQHQILLDERAIQAKCESSRESKVRLRKQHTPMAGKMTVTLKAKKSRETRPRRPCSPPISSCHTETCFAFRVRSVNSHRGPGFSSARMSMPANCISESMVQSRCNIPVSINALTRAFDRTQGKTHQSREEKS
jgi:hypothetical protein